jgi:hypothetical protein
MSANGCVHRLIRSQRNILFKKNGNVGFVDKIHSLLKRKNVFVDSAGEKLTTHNLHGADETVRWNRG